MFSFEKLFAGIETCMEPESSLRRSRIKDSNFRHKMRDFYEFLICTTGGLDKNQNHRSTERLDLGSALNECGPITFDKMVLLFL